MNPAMRIPWIESLEEFPQHEIDHDIEAVEHALALCPGTGCITNRRWNLHVRKFRPPQKVENFGGMGESALPHMDLFDRLARECAKAVVRTGKPDAAEMPRKRWRQASGEFVLSEELIGDQPDPEIGNRAQHRVSLGRSDRAGVRSMPDHVGRRRRNGRSRTRHVPGQIRCLSEVRRPGRGGQRGARNKRSIPQDSFRQGPLIRRQ